MDIEGGRNQIQHGDIRKKDKIQCGDKGKR